MLLSIAGSFLVLAPLSEGSFASLEDRVRELAAEALEAQSLVGVQVAVWTPGAESSVALGRASIELDVPMTPRTRVPIASVAKAMTGLAFLRVERETELDRHRPVQELVPEFPIKPEGELTLDHLVGQVHGIRHYRTEVYPDFFTERFATFEDVLPVFADDPLIARPGEGYTYSSYAYGLLGLALERQTREPLRELVARHVLEPAGMDRTTWNDSRVPIDGRASLYGYFDFRWPFEPSDELVCVPTMDMSYNTGGGNYLSTAEDLVALGRAVLDRRVVDDDGLERLLTSQTTVTGRATGWSHGWFVAGSGESKELRINGSNPGSWAHLRIYPNLPAVVAMTTNTWGRGSRETPRGLMGFMERLGRNLLEGANDD